MTEKIKHISNIYKVFDPDHKIPVLEMQKFCQQNISQVIILACFMMNTAKLVDVPVSDNVIIGYMKTFENTTEQNIEKINGLAYMIREACFCDEDLEKSSIFLSIWNQILTDMNQICDEKQQQNVEQISTNTDE